MKYLEERIGGLSDGLVNNRALAKTLGILLFALFTCMGAFIYFPLPFTPVPLTTQTFFVLLSGLFLKKFEGSISQVIYLLIGLAGLPVFAEASGGIQRLMGPTGGYLLGFIAAPYIVSLLYRIAPSGSTRLRALSAMTAGTLAIHTLGVIGLASFLKIGIGKAILLGSFPFLAGDIIKILAGSEIFCIYQRAFRK